MNNTNPTLAELRMMHNGTSFDNGLAWMFAQSHEERLSILENILTGCYQKLTDGRKDNQKHNEDALSIAIVNMLQMLSIDAEHDRKKGGHCDITVRARENFLWIGEAKIHSGYSWLEDGFAQLSKRYGLSQYGRDHGEIIIYHRGRNSGAIILKWHDRLFEKHEGITLEEDCIKDHMFFRTSHSCRATGRKFFIRHIIIPMLHDPEK